jgi:hypothetical protein
MPSCNGIAHESATSEGCGTPSRTRLFRSRSGHGGFSATRDERIESKAGTVKHFPSGTWSSRFAMPVILQQHFPQDDQPRTYADVEGVLYHYPRQYFERVAPFERFIYYRPLGNARRRPDSLHYFGHGVLGEPWPDPNSDKLRYAPIIQYEPFHQIVSLRDPLGNYYETGTARSPQAQSAVRRISDIAFHRILAAAHVAVTGISAIPVTTAVEIAGYLSVSSAWPKDRLRVITDVPAGAGYVPHDGSPPNVYEAAALQERAREDHQRVLSQIVAKVNTLGGQCHYNNNIDLLTHLGQERLLIEAKSLNDLNDAVHRMRYGLGQLLDYQVRYRAEIEGASPVLAFGRPPDRNTGWIADILEDNGVAFVASIEGALIPLNERGRRTKLFAA